LTWAFEVRRQVVAVVDTLREGPAFDLFEVSPVRMTKRLDDSPELSTWPRRAV
jgi:hypothetical protein